MTKTIWVMEEDWRELELLELYREARDYIDARYPRGDIQASIALAHFSRWSKAHDFLLWTKCDSE